MCPGLLCLPSSLPEIFFPQKFTWLVSSHLIMDAPNQVSVFQKGLLFPFSESTSITVLSYQPVCFLYDTIQKLLSEIFLSVCSWTQPVSYHRMSATPKQRLRLVLCPVGLVHHKISTIFFFLSKRALRIPSFIEQNLGKSALIFLMVYLQLCLVICCNWVEERAYSQTLGYLCNYLIEYMKDL